MQASKLYNTKQTNNRVPLSLSKLYYAWAAMMHKTCTYTIAVGFIAAFSAGCSAPSELSADELGRWIANPKNGLHIEKEMNSFVLTATYKPASYVLTHELREEPANDEILQNRLKEMQDMEYLTLRIDSKDKTKEFLKVGIADQQEYFARLQYFSSQVQNDLYLLQGRDTLPCVFSHLERVYKLSSYGDLLLAFQKKNNQSKPEETTLLYDDAVLGLGPVHIVFAKDKLNQIPALKIQDL